MIEADIIQAHYHSMSDEQLIDFALQDGSKLTSEAFELLKQEFSARQLSTEIPDRIADGTVSAHNIIVHNIENRVMKEFNRTSLSYALNEKADGKSNMEIVAGLIDSGMEEQEALVVVSQLEKQASVLLARSNTRMLSAVFICIAGIAVYIISPNKTFVTFTDIISICAIAIGCFNGIISWLNKNKYQAIKRNITSEIETYIIHNDVA